jgi:hypothetical protein
MHQKTKQSQLQNDKMRGEAARIDCKNSATLKIWNDNVNSGSALATNMHRKRAISTAKWQNAWDEKKNAHTLDMHHPQFGLNCEHI